MTEFLFEIFCEEIPARMQQRAGQDLSKALVDGLKKAGLTVEGEHCYTGPRRLVFTADIPLRSPDISEERKGPRVGSPEQALAGFLRGAGLSDISEAQIRTDPKKGEFYVAVIEKSGADSSAIIAELIPTIMNNFPWPKSMKSGAAAFRWVRPLQSMICLLGGKTVDFEVGGVTTGNTTEGHRRHGKGPYTVTGFADYRKQLEGKGHVMICTCERKDKILTDARAACAAQGLELVEDEGLLNEVAGLAEWPVVILGDMDPSFLELPAEVIRLSMRTHQKYFAVCNPKTNALAPNFIVVANQAAPDGGKEIAKGNSKVLSARLADAQFFQSEDAKPEGGLISYYDKLDTVVFHKKLGSIRDKAERVAALARELAPMVGADADKAEQAAKLAKCDLVTQTVVEFTSLQGQIGSLMYGREVGDADIAVAIEEHYKPQGPSDAVPTNPVAVAVALADKLDTLIGFWAIDEKPTGSKDPFALRRAALGLVRIILDNDVRINLQEFIKSELANNFMKEPFPAEFVENFGFIENLTIQNLDSVRQTLYSFLNLLNSYPFCVNFTGFHIVKDAILQIEHVSSALFTGSENEKTDKYNKEFEKIDSVYFDQKIFRDYFGIALGNIDFENGGLSEKDIPLLQSAQNDIYKDINEITSELLSFILDRLKVYLRDKGIRHDIIDAALTQDQDDLVSIVNRVEALQAFLATSEGENLLAGYKRSANILKAEAKKGDLPSGAPQKPAEKESAALYAALQTASPKIESALAAENYTQAMTDLATLRGPIDAFFTHVQVISDDTAVKENNLRLLLQIRDTARQIADFDRING